MKMFAILKWLFILVLVLLVIALAGINVAAYTFNAPENVMKEYFDKINTPFEIHKIPFDNGNVRFIETGLTDPQANIILFIHGAPGSLENFKTYLADYDLKRRFRLISMDRLGYGESNLGQSELDIAKHAKAAADIIKQYDANKVIVLGHSYGGPVAGKVAADYPSLIDGVIMCAPLNDPKSEPMHWYSKLANWRISRWFLPKFLTVATDEKMNHSVSLKAIESDWQKLNIPVMHLHGEDDSLAPYEANINFSKKNINNEYLIIDRLDKVGHLLIWDDAGYIKEKIIELSDFLNNYRKK